MTRNINVILCIVHVMSSGCEKRGQTLFFDPFPFVTRDRRIDLHFAYFNFNFNFNFNFWDLFFRYLHASVSFRTSEEPSYSYFLLSALHIACSRALVNLDGSIWKWNNRVGHISWWCFVSWVWLPSTLVLTHRNMNSWISILSVIYLPCLRPAFSTRRVHCSDPWETRVNSYRTPGLLIGWRTFNGKRVLL